MSVLLHVDCSFRAANTPNLEHDSISKNIALRIIETWKRNRPKDDYIYRDVSLVLVACVYHRLLGTAQYPLSQPKPF